jgi:hypothetical protein
VALEDVDQRSPAVAFVEVARQPGRILHVVHRQLVAALPELHHRLANRVRPHVAEVELLPR